MANWGSFDWGDGSVYGGGPSAEAGEGIHYRLPGLRYRDGTIYRGLYGGSGRFLGGVPLPKRQAVLLRFFDPDGVRQAEVTSNAGRQILHDLDFSLLPTGPGEFSLRLTDLPGGVALDHEWRMDVHLWNDTAPIYSGFIQEPPLEGGTERGFEFTGYGFFQHIDRVLVTATFAGELVHQAVDELARTYLEPLTGVVYSASKIIASTYRIQGPLKFLRTPLREALQQLARLAGGYEWGVDARREFWFRPASTQVIDAARKWVGKHVQTAVFRANSRTVVNRLYVSLGQARTDLPADDPLYKTNWLEEPLEDTGVGSSQARYGVRDGVHKAPGVLSPTDAIRSAAVELDAKKDAQQRGQVTGVEFLGDPITADGQARITSQDGRNAYTLPIKRVRYSVSSAHVEVGLELGELEPKPWHFAGELVARQAAEELSRQNSQQQF